MLRYFVLCALVVGTLADTNCYFQNGTISVVGFSPCDFTVGNCPIVREIPVVKLANFVYIFNPVLKPDPLSCINVTVDNTTVQSNCTDYVVHYNGADVAVDSFTSVPGCARDAANLVYDWVHEVLACNPVVTPGVDITGKHYTQQLVPGCHAGAHEALPSEAHVTFTVGVSTKLDKLGSKFLIPSHFHSLSGQFRLTFLFPGFRNGYRGVMRKESLNVCYSTDCWFCSEQFTNWDCQSGTDRFITILKCVAAFLLAIVLVLVINALRFFSHLFWKLFVWLHYVWKVFIWLPSKIAYVIGLPTSNGKRRKPKPLDRVTGDDIYVRRYVIVDGGESVHVKTLRQRTGGAPPSKVTESNLQNFSFLAVLGQAGWEAELRSLRNKFPRHTALRGTPPNHLGGEVDFEVKLASDLMEVNEYMVSLIRKKRGKKNKSPILAGFGNSVLVLAYTLAFVSRFHAVCATDIYREALLSDCTGTSMIHSTADRCHSIGGDNTTNVGVECEHSISSALFPLNSVGVGCTTMSTDEGHPSEVSVFTISTKTRLGMNLQYYTANAKGVPGTSINSDSTAHDDVYLNVGSTQQWALYQGDHENCYSCPDAATCATTHLGTFLNSAQWGLLGFCGCDHVSFGPRVGLDADPDSDACCHVWQQYSALTLNGTPQHSGEGAAFALVFNIVEGAKQATIKWVSMNFGDVLDARHEEHTVELGITTAFQNSSIFMRVDSFESAHELIGTKVIALFRGKPPTDCGNAGGVCIPSGQQAEFLGVYYDRDGTVCPLQGGGNCFGTFQTNSAEHLTTFSKEDYYSLATDYDSFTCYFDEASDEIRRVYSTAFDPSFHRHIANENDGTKGIINVDSDSIIGNLKLEVAQDPTFGRDLDGNLYWTPPVLDAQTQDERTTEAWLSYSDNEYRITGTFVTSDVIVEKVEAVVHGNYSAQDAVTIKAEVTLAIHTHPATLYLEFASSDEVCVHSTYIYHFEPGLNKFDLQNTCSNSTFSWTLSVLQNGAALITSENQTAILQAPLDAPDPHKESSEDSQEEGLDKASDDGVSFGSFVSNDFLGWLPGWGDLPNWLKDALSWLLFSVIGLVVLFVVGYLVVTRLPSALGDIRKQLARRRRNKRKNR